MYYCKFWSIAIIILGVFYSNCSHAVKDEIMMIDDWSLVIEQKKNKADCYITSTPYRVKLFQHDIDQKTLFQVTYMGDNQYTISVKAGYNLNEKTPMVIETESVGSFQLKNFSTDTNITFASAQDVFIINKLIESNDSFFKLVTIDIDNNKSIEYFSTRGFLTGLQTMHEKCQN